MTPSCPPSGGRTLIASPYSRPVAPSSRKCVPRCSAKSVLHGAPDVPEVAVEIGGLDVGQQHALALVRLPREADAELLADGAAATVGADEIGAADGLAAVQCGGHTLVVLLEAGHLGAELDLVAQLREPVAQDPLGAPLRLHDQVRVRDVRRRLPGLVHPAFPDDLVTFVAPDARVAAPGGEDLVDDAEVVEDLQRAGLQSLAAHSRGGLGRPLDDAQVHATAGELDGQGQSCRPGADDQYVCHAGHDARGRCQISVGRCHGVRG